jgi:DNA-binding winged helix-turn-helix (wHTH) protein
VAQRAQLGDQLGADQAAAADDHDLLGRLLLEHGNLPFDVRRDHCGRCRWRMPAARPEDFAIAFNPAWICLGYLSKKPSDPGNIPATVGRPTAPPDEDHSVINVLQARWPARWVASSCGRAESWSAFVQFVFENYVLDPDRRELTHGPDAIAAGPQVFDLLLYLVRNRDRVVSKDDLLNAVWDGRIVSESTLTSHINAVRKAIGDSGEEQRLIRTIARKGFRFVGEVTEQPASDGDRRIEDRSPPDRSKRLRCPCPTSPPSPPCRSTI